MELKLIKTVIMLARRRRQDYDTWRDLDKDSDTIIICALKDGTREIIAGTNFNFGQCDCCSGFEFSDIKSYSVYKLTDGTREIAAGTTDFDISETEAIAAGTGINPSERQ